MNNNIGWENPKGNGGNGNYDDTVIKSQINILDDKIDDIDLQLDTKANKTEIPTKVSQLENDSGFTTETYVDNAIANNGNYDDTVIKNQIKTLSEELNSVQDNMIFFEDMDLPNVEINLGGNK